MDAKEQLVIDNTGLVYFVMTQCRIPHRCEEAVSWGNQGLWKAANKFEPERGWKFSTYACPVIRSYLIRYLDRHHRIGKPQDILNKERVARVGASSKDGETWVFATCVDRTVEQNEAAREVKRMLSELERTHPRMARAVVLRFFQQATLTSIAAEFGVCKERARQLTQQGVEWMRDHAA